MSLRTVITLEGNASIVAEASGNLAGPRVAVYIGDTLMLTMPADVADALADALADVEPVITWPNRPISYR